VDIYRVDYDSYLFSRGPSLQSVVDELDAQLDKVMLVEKKYRAVVLICHSLGGNIARAYLKHVTLGQQLTSQAHTHSQSAQMENAAASVAPRLAPGLAVASASEQGQSSTDTQSAASYQQVRDNYQKRHDYLMQIYFTKKCQF
jgi:triacylglycerol esterase/lipase EstA (alpha/beta hydrolase family)